MDKLPSATEAALRGMQTSERRLNEAAHKIATAPVERTEPTELAEAVVETIEAQRAFEASAVAYKRANDAFDAVLEALH